MARSILSVNSKAETFYDLDLLAFLLYMLKVVDEKNPYYAGLEPQRKQWEISVATFAPGTIDIDLDEINSAPLIRELFVSLVSEIIGQLETLQSPISAEFLNAKIANDGIRFQAVNPKKIAIVGKKIISLLVN